MGCGCAISRSGGWMPRSATGHTLVIHQPDGVSGSTPSAPKAAAFPDVIFPSPCASKGLTYIHEDEDGEDIEQQVLFLDIVLIGPHASAVAEGACWGGDAGHASRNPSFVAGTRRPSNFSDGIHDSSFFACSRRHSNLSDGVHPRHSKTAEDHDDDVRATIAATFMRASAPGAGQHCKATNDHVADEVRAAVAGATMGPTAPCAGQRCGAPEDHGEGADLSAVASLPALLVGGAPVLPGLTPEREQAEGLEEAVSPSNSDSELDEAPAVENVTSVRSSLSCQHENAGEHYRLVAPQATPCQYPRLSVTSSTARRPSWLANAGVAQHYSCACQVRSFKVTVNLWPVETLSKHVPSFPVSQLPSTGYVALLPVESATLSDEWSTLKQRFDEVRFHTARIVSDDANSGSVRPRLGRVALYNTEPKPFNMVEGELSMGSDSSGSVASTTLYMDGYALPGDVHEIGSADLCNAASLFQIIVVKTAEWLVNRGAVFYRKGSLGSLNSLKLEAVDTG